jgi:hypothetical protein
MMLLLGSDYQPNTSVTLSGPWLAVIRSLLAAEVLGMLMAGFLVMTLALAWRLTGPKVAFKPIIVVFAYLFSGVWLGFCVSSIVLFLGVQLAGGALFSQFIALVTGTLHGSPPEQWREAEALIEQLYNGPGRGRMFASFLISLAIYLGTATWAVVAWGTLRRVLGTGRLRLLMAAVVWVGMLLGAVRLWQWVV